jgi:NAD(P)-dependent dehydrogenase (short-subunit alcohol dehydrogenase family)
MEQGEDERLVVVTGAASGIGRAIADDFLARGWLVARLDRDAVPNDGPRDNCFDLRCDIRDEQAVIQALGEVQRHFRRPVWACFANAGVSGGSDNFLDVDVNAFRDLVDINLTGTFLTIREAARQMKGRGGRIVATSSIAGLGSRLATGTPYAAAKAGTVNLVQQAALRLARYDITVNAIAPGPIVTGIGSGAMRRDEVQAGFAASVPLGRVGYPRDIIGLARLLAGDDGGYITGQVIAVDGGAVMCNPVPARADQ